MTAVAVAPDGTWLAAACGDGTVQIWDLSTGLQRGTLTGRSGPVDGMAVVPGGTWLATASQDQTLRVWESATGSAGAVMRVDSPLRGCAWSPSGRLIAAVGDAGLYLFAFSS
jgi:WD40 repeat protein